MGSDGEWCAWMEEGGGRREEGGGFEWSMAVSMWVEVCQSSQSIENESSEE